MNSTPGSTSDPVRRSEHPIRDDLRTVADDWPRLPQPVREAIRDMVAKLASGTKGQQ